MHFLPFLWHSNWSWQDVASWNCKEPGHQQPRCRHISPGIFWPQNCIRIEQDHDFKSVYLDMEWLIRVLSFFIWYLIVFGWWSNEVGDEFHYLFVCDFFKAQRDKYIPVSLLRLPHTLYTLVSLIVRRVWLLLIILLTRCSLILICSTIRNTRAQHLPKVLPPWPYIQPCPYII